MRLITIHKGKSEIKILLISNRKSKILLIDPILADDETTEHKFLSQESCFNSYWYTIFSLSEEEKEKLSNVFNKYFSIIKSTKEPIREKTFIFDPIMTKTSESFFDSINTNIGGSILSVQVTPLTYLDFRKTIKNLSEYKTLYKISEELFLLK